jgi:hypothetical protein
MRVSTKIVWDMETGETLEHDFYDYDGPLALCGGGSPDKTMEEEEQEQVTYDQQLMGIFTNQYNTQQAQLQYLQGQMEPMINNPTGYNANQLTTLRTQATDTNSAQFQQAEMALNNQVVDNSGGSKLTGAAGATEESDAALLNSEAQTQASSQDQITEQNAQLQQENYWNAVNALNGVAAQEAPLGYASAESNSANSAANASEANSEHIKATSSSIMSALGGAIGGAAGGLFQGAGNAGGFGALFGCWIAASFFGWNNIKTWVLRVWLHTQAPTWFRKHYLKYGQRIARTHFRWAYRPLFSIILAAKAAV